MIGTNGKEHFLMARWGPEKSELRELAELGRKRWIEWALGKLSKQIVDAKVMLDSLDDLANTHFSGGWTGIY